MMKSLSRRHFFQAILVSVLVLNVVVLRPVCAAPSDSTELTRQITLSKEEADLFEMLAEVRSWIQEFSPRYSNLDVLYRGAIKGMVEALNDPYSQYLTKEQYESLSSSLQGEYVGIGVTIDFIDGQITVVNTFKGSPAEKAGIKTGDVIMGVDERDMRGKMPIDAQAVLRGVADTPVKVRLWRPEDNSTFEVDLIRSVINLDYIEVEDLGDGITYIYISQFTNKVARDFEAVMGYLRMIGIRGIVLDLRGNPGGFLDACVDIAGQLIPKGTVVELRRGDLKEVIESEGNLPVIPTVVLVNRGSASASEILAGAIRDHGVGILVGERTFGKACVQTVTGLGERGGLRLTIADYYTPSGFSLAESGLAPDVEVIPQEMTLPVELAYRRPMARGLVGLDVLALQESLAFLGYQVGEPDGVFGGMTESGAIKMLSDRGMTWQGSFGEEEVRLLDAAILDKVLGAPDTVRETGVQLLRDRLADGHWK